MQFRAGLLTEQETWQKIYEGFERGRNDDRDTDLTLAELTLRMREKRAFMRVYWSGVLYFLEADLALRKQDGGQYSVDRILREFGTCCLDRPRRWSGRQIAAEFDRIAAADIFVPLYDEFADTTSIPDYLEPLAAAGVQVHGDRVAVTAPGFLRSTETRMNPDDVGRRNHLDHTLSYVSNNRLGNATECACGVPEKRISRATARIASGEIDPGS